MSPLHKLKNKVMLASRASKLDHFYSLCNERSTVLDVGVSDNELDEPSNLFLKQFRLAPDRYTGLAIRPMDGLRNKYPGKTFVEYPGGVFPFADHAFDWVFSNAVIEHVGNRADQLAFLDEMLRVGKNVFFTTPNKWFPVESHTNVLFWHWFDGHFYDWCRTHFPYWSIDNLLLFGKADLKTLMRRSNADHYTIRSNRTFMWPMTFTVVCSTRNS